MGVGPLWRQLFGQGFRITGEIVGGAAQLLDPLRMDVGTPPIVEIQQLRREFVSLREEIYRTGQEIRLFSQITTQSFISLMDIATPFFQMISGNVWLGDFYRSAQHISSFLRQVQSIFGILSQLAERFIYNFTAGLNFITNSIQRLNQTISGLLQTFITTIDFFTNLLTAPLRDFANIFMTTIRTLSPMIGGAIAAIFLKGNIPAAIIAFVTGILTGIVTGFTSVLTQAVPAILNLVFVSLMARLAGLPSVLPIIAAPILYLIGRLLEGIVPLLQNLSTLLSSFVQVLGTALETLATFLSKVAEGLNLLIGVTAQIVIRFLQVGALLWEHLGAVAARIETVGVALATMARNYGISRDSVLNFWEALTKQNIALIEGGESMILLLARSPVLVALINQLAETAKDWGSAMGFVSSQVLRDFAVAVTRGNMEMLEHLNIVYPSSIAWQWFAQQIGKSAENLNALERSLAVANFLIQQIGRSVKGVYEETFESLGKLLTSFARVYQEITGMLGAQLIPAFNAIGRSLYATLSTLKEAEGLQTLFARIGEGVLIGLERIFGTREWTQDPEKNPIAIMIKGIVDSPAFREFGLRLQAIVAFLTEAIVRSLLALLTNLPRILESTLQVFRVLLSILATFWGYIINIGQALTTLFGGQMQRLQDMAITIVTAITNIMRWFGDTVGRVGIAVASVIRWLGESLPNIAANLINILNLLIRGFEILVRFFSGLGLIFAGLFNLLVRLMELLRFISPLTLAGLAPPLGPLLAAFSAIGRMIGDQLGTIRQETADTIRLFREGWRLDIQWQLPSPQDAIQWGQQVRQGFVSAADAIRQHAITLSQVLTQGSAAAYQWGMQAAQATTPLRDRAVEIQTIQGRINQVLGEQTKQVQQMMELWREWAKMQEVAISALEANAKASSELYGTWQDILYLKRATVDLAWQIVQVEFTNLVYVLHIANHLATTRDRIGSIFEVWERLSKALAQWAEAVNAVFQTAIGYAEKLHRLLADISQLPRQEFFWSPLAAAQSLQLLEQSLLRQREMLLMWLNLPLGAERFMDVLERLIRVEKDLLQVQYEMVTVPLQMMIKGLDAVRGYWSRVADFIRQFNLGMYGILNVHILEAQVLLEKLRLLELSAEINRHNYQLYWQIRQEIIATKQELFDIARRPVFFFGMTREQIERALRDFTTTMADPGFWARWRLGGALLPEMALRVAIWRQQPGMAAMQVVDPNFLNILFRQAGAQGLFGAFPLLRWWGLLEQVTGRTGPVDFRTMMQALQAFFLSEFLTVPPPFTGPAPFGYFRQFYPSIEQAATMWGRPMPAPFQTYQTIATTMTQDLLNTLKLTNYYGNVLAQQIANMGQTLRIYLPPILQNTQNIASVLNAFYAFWTRARQRQEVLGRVLPAPQPLEFTPLPYGGMTVQIPPLIINVNVDGQRLAQTVIRQPEMHRWLGRLIQEVLLGRRSIY